MTIKKAYCDLIAHLIKQYFNANNDGVVVTKISYDLHPTKGYLQSTKKILEVKDFNNKRYTITVEEVDE